MCAYAHNSVVPATCPVSEGRKGIIGVRVFILVTVICVGLTGASSGAAQPTVIGKAPVAKRTSAPPLTGSCPYARLGVAFYRGRFIQHQVQRNASIPSWRKPRNCADARYLAFVWARGAYASRMQTKKHLEALEARRNEHPRDIALRLLQGDRVQWGCLMSIVAGENRAMIPTLDFGGGHGNVYEAYGIPQANPGYKMRSAGPDWRTNPETQLRWMIGYCRGRYGSVCGAARARRTQGWY